MCGGRLKTQDLLITKRWPTSLHEQKGRDMMIPHRVRSPHLLPTSLGGIVAGSLIAGPLVSLLGLQGALTIVPVAAATPIPSL
jgi:hypothetical protein